jgi:hypothetical protein
VKQCMLKAFPDEISARLELLRQRGIKKETAAIKGSRWWEDWERECLPEFVHQYYVAEEKCGVPRRLRRKRPAAMIARQIVLQWLELSEEEKFAWLHCQGHSKAGYVAADLAYRLERGDTDVLRAVADYVDALKNDKWYELTERLFDYARQNRGRPVHNAREIKDRFAPHLQMRMSEWNEFLRLRAVPYLPGPKGRPRKNG